MANTQAQGKIVQCIGAVVDVEFARDQMPKVYDALKLEGSAGEGGDTLFKFELEYCGVFRLLNIPQEQIHPVIMIECPRILFPFARQIVADAVRNGGFPPLYLDPVDFAALYMQRVAEAQQGQASGSIA